MSDRIVYLCPGQGAQAVGMGKAWYEASAAARDVFAEADAALGDRLGGKLSTLCFEGPAERLNQTDVSQPAIYVTSIACHRGLVERQDSGDLVATAGLSLGEYTALCLAGVFSFVDGLLLVAQRGRFMQDAAEASRGSMVALTGADEAQAEAICRRASGGEELVCANFNAPSQIVLSGAIGACERAVAVAGEMGIRATPLTVAGAFHSALMAPAAERMAAALEAVRFEAPRCPVVSNVTAEPHDSAGESIKRRLVEQITSPVRWNQSCAWINGHIDGKLNELAPGKVLSGLMRRINREAKVVNHDRPIT